MDNMLILRNESFFNAALSKNGFNLVSLWAWNTLVQSRMHGALKIYWSSICSSTGWIVILKVSYSILTESIDKNLSCDSTACSSVNWYSRCRAGSTRSCAGIICRTSSFDIHTCPLGIFVLSSWANRHVNTLTLDDLIAWVEALQAETGSLIDFDAVGRAINAHAIDTPKGGLTDGIGLAYSSVIFIVSRGAWVAVASL